MFTLARIGPRIWAWASLALILALLASLFPAPQLVSSILSTPAASAQGTALGPQPGDVFRQFQDNLAGNATMGLCNAPGTDNCGGRLSTGQRQALNVTLRDPARGEEAVRAEAVFEYWGGHLGTTDQKFNVHGRSWSPFPGLQGIPSDSLSTCYFRQVTNAVHPFGSPDDLRPDGNNNNSVNVVYNYSIGPQMGLDECAAGANFYWGEFGVYEVTTRVYYNTTNRPSGAITAPAEGGSFGENPTFTVTATAPAGRTISRVDLIGNYLDYDWDGDGLLREWHYALRRGVWERTIGTRTSPSSGPANGTSTWNFTWNTTWVPDQDQPVQLMARITDSTGLSYMTPLVSANFNRAGRSVRMYNTWSDYYGTRVFGPPRSYGVNVFQFPKSGKITNISIPDPLTNALRARFMIYTWSGNSCCEDLNGDGQIDGFRTSVRVNNQAIWGDYEAFGKWHDYSFDSKDFPNAKSFLVQGDNRLLIFSDRRNHKLEVLWPGPAIFVEFSSPPSTPGLVANDITLSTPEDQPLALNLPVQSGPGGALKYTIVSPPLLGKLSGEAPTLTYTPNANANGTDSFLFRVSDQYGRSAQATVTIDVQSVPDVPQIIIGEGALLNPGDRFQRIAKVIDPDSAGLSATVNYGDGAGDFPLTIGTGGVLQLDYVYRDGGRFPLTITVNDGQSNGTATALITVLTPGSPAPTGQWALSGYRYRFPIQADAGSFPRLNRVAEFDTNFSAALSQAGGSGAVIPESIRVVEVDGSGTVVDSNVTYQFDPRSDFNASSNARGTLLVLMKGNTPAGSSRSFHVYFETSGSFKAPEFTPLVQVTNPALPNYRRDTAAVIETRNPGGERNTTYYYSLYGGAFISMLDKLNVDWIDYSTKADSSGAYRGVPNAGGVFHPGFYNRYPEGLGNDGGSNQGSFTTIVRQGPLRTTLRSVSSNGQWQATWEIFPTSARMTMDRTPNGARYWWLYEGVPGGLLEPSDRWVTGDNRTSVAYDETAPFNEERFFNDIAGPEWIYFRAGEPAQNGRAVWVAHHNDDNLRETYRSQSDGFGRNGAMTVFGFGRREQNDNGSQTLEADLTGVRRFSMGFLENAPAAVDPSGATGQMVEGFYRDLGVSVGQGQRLLSNLAPWAGDDTFRTRVGQTLDVAAPGLRANDNDGDGDSVTIALVTQPTNGTLTFNANGSFRYVPNAGFSGTDSFTYSATDGKHPAPAATVTIRVTNNNAPSAPPSSSTTNDITPLSVPAPGVLAGASDADGDPLTAVLIDPPFSGTLVLNPNGGYSYTPQAGFVGVDTFTFAATDGMDQSAPVTVQIVVTPSNRAPAAVGSSASTAKNRPIVMPAPGVLAGASDADGDPLTAVLLGQPTNGTVALNADGSYTYTPNADFVGVDSFTFAASDGKTQSEPAAVEITVREAGTAQLMVYLPIVRR